MALYSDLSVYKATYDLLLAIFQFTKEFGKEYKYTIGESLKKETIDLLMLCKVCFQKKKIYEIPTKFFYSESLFLRCSVIMMLL